jgi:hypothetical protein
VIVWMPVGHVEEVPKLREREGGTAAGNMPQLAIVRYGLSTRRVDGIRPRRRRFSGIRKSSGAHGRRHTHCQSCCQPSHVSPRSSLISIAEGSRRVILGRVAERGIPKSRQRNWIPGSALAGSLGMTAFGPPFRSSSELGHRSALCHAPRYARLTSGFCASSRAGPNRVTRPFSST